MNVKKSLVYVRIFLVLICHVVFVSLVVARIEGNLRWSWAAVFTPLFLIDVTSAVYYASYVYGFTKQLRDGWNDSVCYPGNRSGITPVVLTPLGLVLKLTAEVLLALHLELSISFIPCGIITTCFFATTFIGMLLYTVKPNFNYFMNK